jgi:DNA-binding response OmpR family regulator
MGKNLLFINHTGAVPSIPGLLAANGYGVDEVSDPEMGLRRLDEADYGVIIALEDAASTSWQLCEKIRCFTGAPLIVISTDASTEACLKTISAGADYFLRKRYGPLELLARVSSLLQRTIPRQTMPVGS